MRQSLFTTLVSFILLTASAVLAQTTAPTPAPAPTGGIGTWWWIILIIVIVVAAVWYFGMHRRRP